ncbi:hypothetical protein DXG01_010646, partial [Tephrocybe rancida]
KSQASWRLRHTSLATRVSLKWLVVGLVVSTILDGYLLKGIAAGAGVGGFDGVLWLGKGPGVRFDDVQGEEAVKEKKEVGDTRRTTFALEDVDKRLKARLTVPSLNIGSSPWPQYAQRLSSPEQWDVPSNSYMALWRGVTSPTGTKGASFRNKAGRGVRLAVQRYADILCLVEATTLLYCCNRHSYLSNHNTLKAFDATDSLVATFHLQNDASRDAVYSYGPNCIPYDWPWAPTGENNKWQARNIVVEHTICRHSVNFSLAEKEF